MPSAGSVAAVYPFGSPNTPGSASSASSGGPLRSVYDSAVQTQGQNYDDIMAGYDSLQKRAASGTAAGQKLNYTPINAQAVTNLPQYSYTRSSDFGNLVNNLEDYGRTGGYSDQNVADIRARGLSPIRTAYANAQRNLARQKVLQGGYMPNAGAVYSKMAREQGELGSTASTAINAQVAQMIAEGKLAAFGQLSPLLSGENSAINNASNMNVSSKQAAETGNVEDQRHVRDLNAQAQLEVERLNSGMDSQNNNLELGALQGKTNLYGTTPALTSTFGNQVLQNNAQNLSSVQTANAIKNQRAQLGINLVGSAGRAGFAGATIPF